MKLEKKQLDTVFKSVIIARIAYAAPAWSGLVSKEQEGKIDAFLGRSTQNLFTFKQISHRADHTYFNSIKDLTNCLNQLNPEIHDKGHSYIAKLYPSTVQRHLYQSLPVWLYCLLISLGAFCVMCFIRINEYSFPCFNTAVLLFLCMRLSSINKKMI